MRVHTPVFSWRIYLNTRQREISIRPCTAWRDVCPRYYWPLWIMKRAEDYRAARRQEVAPSNNVLFFLCRLSDRWARLARNESLMACWTSLPTSHRWTSTTWLLRGDDRLTLGRVGVADPRGAGGCVPRRWACWGRLALIQKKKKNRVRGGCGTQETCSILPEKLCQNISCCTSSKRQNNCHLNCAMHFFFLHSHCQNTMRGERERQKKNKTDGARRFANNSTKAIKNPTVDL